MTAVVPLRAACRACGGEAGLVAQRTDVSLYRCERCRFVSGRPAEQRPDRGYSDHYFGTQPPDPVSRYDEWLAQAERRAGGAGHLLEVGAGGGGFVRAALARGWRVDALETSASAVERLQQTGCHVFAGSLDGRVPSDTYDLVAALEVLEHVPAPVDLLRECHRVSRRGGQLLLTTPNYDGLSRRFLGLRWRVIAAEHLGYFTPGTLRDALQKAGFDDVRVRARSLDVTSWRKTPERQSSVSFDPVRAARLRDGVQSRPLLRAAREMAHALLGVTRLGDSLLAWARRR